MRYEGYVGPQNTEEGVFIFILYLNHQVKICAYFDNINFIL